MIAWKPVFCENFAATKKKCAQSFAHFASEKGFENDEWLDFQKINVLVTLTAVLDVYWSKHTKYLQHIPPNCDVIRLPDIAPLLQAM